MLHCYHAASSVVESTLLQECVLESSVHLSPVSKARVGLQFMVEVEGDRLGSHPRLFESAKVKSKGSSWGHKQEKEFKCQQPELLRVGQKELDWG